jgi:AcrR family transcriptional regulator
MGNPGIPARLRKIAALSERGSASAGLATSHLAGSEVAGSGPEDRKPAGPAGTSPTDAADTTDTAQAGSGPAGSGPAGSGPAGSGPAGSGPADAEPEVTGHIAVELTPARPVVKALGAVRRTTRTARPRRGRPRSERADRDILLAATQLLADKGVSGLTIEEVALRAGVAKTTIYRRWSSRGTLALDAFLAEIDGQRALPDTGAFSGDLRAALGNWVGAVAGTSAGVMLVGLIAEVHKDRGLAMAWQDQVIAPLRAQYSIMLDRAISRGEIPADTDAGVVLDLVFGACYYRLLHGHRPLNEQFVNQVVDIVAVGVGAHSNLAGDL